MYVYYAIIYIIQIVFFGTLKSPFYGEYMKSFNPDNCGVRLIPSTVFENWLRKLSSSDSDIVKRFYVSSSFLYENSISPTEDQFLQILGNEDVTFTD